MRIFRQFVEKVEITCSPEEAPALRDGFKADGFKLTDNYPLNSQEWRLGFCKTLDRHE